MTATVTLFTHYSMVAIVRNAALRHISADLHKAAASIDLPGSATAPSTLRKFASQPALA